MTGQSAKGGRGGAIHHLFPTTRQPDDQDVSIALRCVNLAQIGRAYGEEVCRLALRHVARTVAGLLGEGGFVNIEADDRLEAVLRDRGLLSAGPPGPACDEFVRSLCMAIMVRPFEHGEHRIHLSFTGVWSMPATAAADGRVGLPAGRRRPHDHGWPRSHGAFPADEAQAGDGRASRYRADMALASELLGLMATDRLTLVWQRIAHAPDEGDILYHEALLRIVADDGADRAPADMLGALERLGLARSLDQFVVARVIDELEAHPAAMLGVNISAQSAVLDAWWAEAERRLAGNRALARRLVIEITETAALPSISEAIHFADRMRALGCRIAMDDFGVGHASIRQLIALKPDIVKVADFFMRRAAGGEHAALGHMIGLARSVAPVVIMEGVENAADSEFAAQAGARWQQGWFWGRPGAARSRGESDAHAQPAALLPVPRPAGPTEAWR